MIITASSRNGQKIEAFKKIHADFIDIVKHEKCRTCSCFYGDVLNKVYDKLKRVREIESNHDLLQIENDFERWLKDVDLLKAHG
jgi:hypothetical protein